MYLATFSVTYIIIILYLKVSINFLKPWIYFVAGHEYTDC